MKPPVLNAAAPIKKNQPYGGEDEFTLIGWSDPSLPANQPVDLLCNDLCHLARRAALAEHTCQATQNEHASELKRMLLNLLDVMDKFETVLQRIHSKRAASSKQVKKWVRNFQTVYRMLRQMLDDYDVSQMQNAEEGFDPRWHAVFELVAEPSHPDGTIIDVVQTGYFWRGQVLRKASVTVVKNTAN
jgi:molecular chaperone GrpE (heat shock protein)